LYVACGHANHADYNASANAQQIFGIGASACRGAFPLETPTIRKMDTSVAAQLMMVTDVYNSHQKIQTGGVGHLIERQSFDWDSPE